eukprot:jgi/Botrbrau1/17852/Bobra.0127s0092.1
MRAFVASSGAGRLWFSRPMEGDIAEVLKHPAHVCVSINIISTLYIFFISFSITCSNSIAADPHRESFDPRPPHTGHAAMARWLLHENDWGTVSTLSRHLNGMPYGNALSFSDGPHNMSTGRLLFYLTGMDATASDVEANNTATLTVCEAQLPGHCRGFDPEDPTCAKVSASGTLKKVPPQDLALAEDLLLQRHPAMRDWPAGHAFHVYELHIETLRLLDFYGGAVDIDPADYFNVHLLALAQHES